MQFIFYGIVFLIAAMAVAGFVQNLLYPPVEISQSELPANVQRELDKFFPAFQPGKILYQENRRRYTMTGKNANRECKLKIELEPDGEMDEVEFKDRSGPTALENISRISVTAVPQHVAEIMNAYLIDDATPIENSRACSAMINRENAFKIDLRTSAYKYEFEITESGRIVEFEKEKRHV